MHFFIHFLVFVFDQDKGLQWCDGCRIAHARVNDTRRVLLSEAMNAGAHGHIHELLGGAWALEWQGFYARTEDIILPFTHTIVVRGRGRGRELNWCSCLCLCLLPSAW